MKKIILLFLIVSVSLMGQSAYYRLGYGDLYPSVGSFGSSVGEGAVAWQDTFRYTPSNAANVSGLKRVYFGGSLGSEFNSTADALTNNTRLEQIFLAFPINKKTGLSLGIHAISDLKTNYQSDLIDGTFSENTRGGIWDYHLGLGYAFSPALRLGLKLHLLQGAIRRESNIRSLDQDELYVINGNIQGKSLELGLISDLGDKVTLGFTADIPYVTPVMDGQDSLAGTETFVEITEELTAWPTTIKLGVVYHHSRYTKFVAGIGQKMFPEAGFADAHVFALPVGWETVPVASFQVSMLRVATDHSSRNWTKRTGWQAGFSAKNYYLTSSADQLMLEYSLISGLNFGLRNGRSLFDISGEFGTRGGEESLPEEMFARIKFGIQVNDIWFRKVKRR